MKKYFFTLIILLLTLLGFSVYQYFKFNDGKMHLTFCNVGQGDGIFIRTPKGMDILIDSGPDDSILNCLSSHMPFWDRDIELAILTHPHSDHMRGFISVFQRYKISNFATESLINTTQLYKELVKILQNQKMNEKILYSGDAFKITDGVSFKIIGPSREFASKTPNGIIKESSEDASLVTLLSFGQFDAILTGDAPINEIAEAIDNFPLPKIEVFQIPHHGSKYNITQETLESISPKNAIISVGKNNYGHPSPQVIQYLSDSNIQYLRTDKHGDIEIIANKNGQFSVR